MKINKILFLFVLLIITGCVGASSTGVFGTGGPLLQLTQEQ